MTLCAKCKKNPAVFFITKMENGKIVPDSGAMSSKADVFLAELNEAPQVIQEEEIVGHIALDWEQLGEWIRDGKITDSFTLAAYAKMSLQK